MSEPVIGEGVEIGHDVRFGAHVVVHDGTVIGDGCVIEDGVVLGKRPRLAGRATPDLPPLRIVYAGSEIGADAIVGDQAQVRERTTIGERTVIGRGAGIDNDVRLGARVKVQSQVYVTAHSVVEDDVFLGPGASTTNDDTMGRHGPDHALRGATIRRAARIGGSAVLVPGVEIGEEAFVAAGAVVTKDVPPRALVMGVPARQVRAVMDDELLERWRHPERSR